MYKITCKACRKDIEPNQTQFMFDGFIFCSIDCTGKYEAIYETWINTALEGRRANEKVHMS